VIKPAGTEKALGILSAAYFMDPTDPQWKDDPAMKEWAAFMKKYYPEGNLTDPFNVYGFAVAQTLHEVLKQSGDNLTRANVMKQAASLKGYRPDTLLPGIRINTGANDYAPIESEQLVQFDGETFRRFGPIIGK
jgi:branched-chain amino acid transport system substrate-binding protein